MKEKRLAIFVVSVLLVLAGRATIAQSDQSSGARVIGGVYASPGAWPFPAYVLIAGNYQCGGTLVAPRFVLTAGHCAADPQTRTAHQASEYEIRLGSIYANRDGEIHHVVRVIPHEGFGERFPLENDIALLELDNPTSIKPVPLDGMPDAGGGRSSSTARINPYAKILGWGRTNADPTVSSLSDRLREAAIPIVDNKSCQGAMTGTLGKFGPIDDRRLCAGQSSGGVDSCNGDSGGPILSEASNGEWVQVGIVSYGVETCGREGAYGVYTRVRAFHDWLAKNLDVDEHHTPPPEVPPSPIAAASAIVQAADNSSGRVRVSILNGGKFDPNAGTCARAAEPAPAAILSINDCVLVQVTSAITGYLFLLDISEDGTVMQLFPNRYSGRAYADGRISAGTHTFPSSLEGFALPASLSVGRQQERNRIVAIVTERKEFLKGFGDATKGLTDIGGAPLFRLEVVARPASGATSADANWAAGDHDYIVSR